MRIEFYKKGGEDLIFSVINIENREVFKITVKEIE